MKLIPRAPKLGETIAICLAIPVADMVSAHGVAVSDVAESAVPMLFLALALKILSIAFRFLTDTEDRRTYLS